MMWEECKDLQEYIVGLRRDLHQIPEVGFDLPETQAYVTAELNKIGIPYVCSEKFIECPDHRVKPSKPSEGHKICKSDDNR